MRRAACPDCGREMPVNCLPKHRRTHGDRRLSFAVSLDEQAEMVRRYGRGETLAAISAAMYWSRTEVRRVLLANGVRLRPPGSGGLREVDRRRIDVDEELQRIHLYGLGLSVIEVAAAVGVSAEAVRQTLVRAGVPRRPVGTNLRWARRASS